MRNLALCELDENLSAEECAARVL